eukprot:360458-Chlamydomonas_euryale.AAC.8
MLVTQSKAQNDRQCHRRDDVKHDDNDDWLYNNNAQPQNVEGFLPRRPDTPITALWRSMIGTCWFETRSKDC